ncbi:twitch domain-containing radical SAM protein [bacterium SCSIO 12643]|nr:twitch domain-containing radical SAM protein [bacterium SCSIO 12643]
MENSKPYCLMPWIHFHVGDNGLAKACCVANIPFGNINTSPFEDIWNGESIQKLRSRFLNGEPDKRCAQCVNLEAAGGKSIRQETYEKFAHLDISLDSPVPIYFDIRFSNVCNLKCRTCWHGASSSWFEDAKKLKTQKGQKAVIQNIQDFHRFIAELGTYLRNAKEIYFAGGEPLVTEEHYLLLNWLIEQRQTKVKLRYNTNFTFLKYKQHDVLELWQNFESVEVMASLDAIGPLSTYIRSGSKWNKVIQNFNRIQSIPNIQFKISPTISVLNIQSITDLISYTLDNHMISEKGLYINILERPIHYNIQILPHSKKEQIDQKIKTYISSLSSKRIQDQLQEILQYMWAQDLSTHWEKFHLQNGKIDHIREETFPLFS